MSVGSEMHSQGKFAVRQGNAMGAFLAESTCIFRVRTSSRFQSSPDDKLLGSFEEAGGSIVTESTGADSHLFLLINHGLMDAFGGLFVASQSPSIQRQAATVSAGSGLENFEHEGVRITHKWGHDGNVGPLSAKSTFTQAYVGRLLARAPVVESIDVCVACDDLLELDSSAIRGNSFRLVRMNRKRAETLSLGEKGAWSDFLKKRALRALDMSGFGGEVTAADVLISSVGDLTKLRWYSRQLDPTNFAFFPTPAKGAVNILLWSYSGQQAISVGYHTADAAKHEATAAAAIAAWEATAT